MKTAQTAQPYEWDFDGSCRPGGPGAFTHSSQETFSVGIFQWIPKESGKGLKRSAVVKRIKGFVSDPESVYKRAQQECEKRNMKGGNVY